MPQTELLAFGDEDERYSNLIPTPTTVLELGGLQ